MANTVAIKIMIPESDAEEIDRLVNEKRYASRADFCSKAVFLLLAASDGRFSTVADGREPQKLETGGGVATLRTES